MAVENASKIPLTTNGAPMPAADVALLKEGVPQLGELDPSKLKINLTPSPKTLPAADDLIFGKHMSDHMLVAEYTPEHGWGAPEIKPFGPITVDPSASCFQYCTNCFEGMKAYMGPDGVPRLFRPEKNMARLQRSVDRLALPPFSAEALVTLIKKLVMVDKHWIPTMPDTSLYIRPTIIGTRPGFGVVASSTHAMLYVLLSPTGKFFKVPKGISLLAVNDNVRAWPGGTGDYKLGVNYAPGFRPQQKALEQGYQQILWLLHDTVTEAGAMNFFLALKRDDGDIDIITPPLDGTILPGVTRESSLELFNAHGKETSLPNISNKTKLHAREQSITMTELVQWSKEGRLLEAICVGTGAVVTSVARIGWKGEDIHFPEYDGNHVGPVASALRERLVDIQSGRVEWKGWSVLCSTA
ncbi:branched-chain amino acid aminotransferase II [Peniophora sp. CONT]|nr:branched-chain amino acid aminotransferase II [Peniophora sp. CONT]